MTLSEQVPAHNSTPVTRRHVFNVAWPVVLSNASVPLLGLVDTAIMGHMGAPGYIGAVALGGVIFNYLYWGFGFLRMGTTGLVAQAYGTGDTSKIRWTVWRTVLLGTAIGVVLIILQSGITWLAFSLFEGSGKVEGLAAEYFVIRIWGAPATLVSYAILGYFLGLQKSRTALVLQLWLNSLNIALDFWFVVGMGLGVRGVAFGTLIAEWSMVVLGLVLIARHLLSEDPHWPILKIDWAQILDRATVIKTLTVNADIMIRTLCLIFALSWFASKGARAGDVVFDANAILMMFVSFAAFFLDGFAFAAESLVGAAFGARKLERLRKAVRYSTELAVITAIGVSLTLALGGSLFIDFMTDVQDVREIAYRFLPWAIAAPILSIWCFQLDGIFIGATQTAEMRNAMIFSLVVFLAAWFILSPQYDNHGLWASLMIFYVVRALSLYAYYPALKRNVASNLAAS